jgi:hypothetical protein
VFRSASSALLLLLVICVCGCAPKVRKTPPSEFGGTLIPLWSMPFGCGGGFHINEQTVQLIDREMLVDNHLWTFDLSTGQVLRHSEQPVPPEALPPDSHVAMTGGIVRPLDPSSAKAIIPSGFNPLVMTDKYVFAKKRWLGLDFPRFVLRSEVIAVDRSSRNILWHFDAPNIVVQANFDRVVVCGNRRVFAFLPLESRPKQIADFYAAIRRGDVSVVLVSFDAWQKTRLYDLDGYDPLTLAAKEGKIDVVKALLALKVSPNAEVADGYSPLLAAIAWHPEIVPILLDAGADPNNYAHYWEFPLTSAIENGDQAAVEQLLKSGARINATDHLDGQTALHAAVLYRNYAGIEALLKAGADPLIRDSDGKTAIALADPNECLSHLFSGGKVSDKPVACAPIQTSSTTVQF